LLKKIIAEYTNYFTAAKFIAAFLFLTAGSQGFQRVFPGF
jgi:hypothetical protein